jgi:hypothetical protein
VLLLSWLVFPSLLVAIAVGHGLIVRRLSPAAVEPLLVLPVGLMAVVVLATAGTWSGVTAPFTGPLLIATGVAGMLVGRADLRLAWQRRHGLIGPVAMVAAAFVTFGASVFLSGSPTFTGYTQIVDIGHQFDIAAWLATHGREIPVAASSSQEVVRKVLEVGYPSGSQAPLGTLARVTSLEIAWIYQPYVTVFAASLVLPLFVLLRRAVARTGLRLVAAFAAAQPSLLVGYGQMGGIKEVSAALSVLLVAALLPPVLDERQERSARPFAGVAVAVAGAFSILSLVMVPWLGVLMLGAFLVTWRSSRGMLPALRVWAPRWVLVVLLTLPTIVSATRSGGAASTTQSEELGNLAEPVDRIATAGIWLTSDHRFPLTDYRALSMAGGILVLVLAVLGVVAAARRRDQGLLLLGIAGAVAYPFMVWRFGPWVELKTMVITGPILLVLAMAGAGALLARRRSAPAAYFAVAAITALVLFANALRYHDATLAPYDRLDELEAIGERFTTGKTLHPDFDELAEYFLRRGDATSPVNPPEGRFSIRPEVVQTKGPGIQFVWDLDEFEPSFVQDYKTIVLPRRAGRSRPPANYRLRYEGRYYAVWEKSRGAIADARAPLSGTGAPSDAAACRAFSRTQLAQDRRVTVAPSAASALADPTTGFVSPGWAAPGPPALLARGAGRATTTVRVAEAGTYSVLVGMSSVRETRLFVDGKLLGSPSHQVGYPGNQVTVGRVVLKAGDHEVSLVRPGGSLAPGNGDGTGRSVGPIWLVREDPQADDLLTVRRKDVRRSCGVGPLDWVESRD